MSEATNSSAGATFSDRLNGSTLYFLSQMVRTTCKFQVTNLEYLTDAMSSGRPLIFAGWHGLTMMMEPLIQTYHEDMSRLEVIMPDEWRGMALRVWVEKIGGVPQPMNLKGDNTMGMARKLVGLTRNIMGGHDLYINPDGPDGPAHQPKPGIAFIARKAKAVIIPLGAYARHAYVVPRWDRYTIPYPFSKVAYYVGDPIEALPDNDDETNELIRNTLNEVMLQAAADYYEKAE